MYIIAPIINVLIFLAWIFLAEEKQIIHLDIPIWIWMVFVFYLVIRRYADGLQNTTRNLARIVLLKMNESDDQFERTTCMQILLTPDFTSVIGVFWVNLSIVAFASMLFSGGWLLGILAITLPALGFPWFFPIFYGFHMNSVKNYVFSSKRQKIMGFMELGVPFSYIEDVLTEGVEKKRNPQKWWAELKYGNLKQFATDPQG